MLHGSGNGRQSPRFMTVDNQEPTGHAAVFQASPGMNPSPGSSPAGELPSSLAHDRERCAPPVAPLFFFGGSRSGNCDDKRANLGCSAPSRAYRRNAGTCHTFTSKGFGRTMEVPMARATAHPNHQLISSEDVEGTHVYGVDGVKIGEIDHLRSTRSPAASPMP
jgi:hypothetical protein